MISCGHRGRITDAEAVTVRVKYRRQSTREYYDETRFYMGLLTKPKIHRLLQAYGEKIS